MSDSYQTLRIIGGSYEDYIIRRLREEGEMVTPMLSSEDQRAHGDARIDHDGHCTYLEIKFDRKFHKTGNLYIEVEERRLDISPDWVPGGICAGSDVTWYGIGDYRDWHVFRRTDLIAMIPQATIIEIDDRTSRGWLMATDTRQRLLVMIRHWSDRLWDGQGALPTPIPPSPSTQTTAVGVSSECGLWLESVSDQTREAWRDIGRTAFGLQYDQHGNVVSR